MISSDDISSKFSDFYQAMGYQSLPSAPLIDPSIPMSFVMSAGLVQVENSLAKSNYKDGSQYFLVQNCFRYFDIEKVGTDDFHLSFFEMPGAFVFGPNGKSETVRRMWTLATSVLGINKEKIWASYFRGGKVLDSYLPEDAITRQTWLKLGLPTDHIVGLGPEHNYWMQGKGMDGSSGKIRKCGPNTELFYDRGKEKACSVNCEPGCKCGRFVEFANSLFINSEFTETESAPYPLAQPFTETVIGTERVAMILQKAKSVFETSGLKPIVEAIHPLVCVQNLSEITTTQEHVIADHIRGLYFLIADGAPAPGKNGRARIIKMLIRRVVTLQIILGINPKRFLPAILNSISQVVPSDMRATCIQEKVSSYFLFESHRYSRTIERGIRQLTNLISKNGNQTLTETQILSLEKHWGLPALLISFALQERGFDSHGIEPPLSQTCNSHVSDYDGRLHYDDTE